MSCQHHYTNLQQKATSLLTNCNQNSTCTGCSACNEKAAVLANISLPLLLLLARPRALLCGQPVTAELSPPLHRHQPTRQLCLQSALPGPLSRLPAAAPTGSAPRSSDQAAAAADEAAVSRLLSSHGQQVIWGGCWGLSLPPVMQ